MTEPPRKPYIGCCSCSASKLCGCLQPRGLQHTRFPVLHYLPEFAHSHPLNWWCPPTISSSVTATLLLSTYPSIRVFSSESVLCIRWPKYCSFSFSFSISPSNEYSQLTSFMIDRFDLLAVQGTVKSLLQHHDSKVSILQYSAFFMVQLSHPYITGKSIILRSITLPNLIHLLCHLNTLWLPIYLSSVLPVFPLILINHSYFINQGEVLV